jgi:DNA repair protein RecO (recombination protein O)
MEWTDQGIVLSARPHGEAAAVATLLTRSHGRHAGLVHGGRSPKQRGALQPGNRVSVRWRARLAEHLGSYTVELEHSAAAALLDDPLRLAGLAAAAAVTELALPEREPHEPVFNGLAALLDALETSVWAEVYVRWEIGLLQELGFGLDLSQCAATGTNDALAYVSPRTGRAVSLSAGEPFRDRLLPLPGFLAGQGGGGPAEVLAGLELTGYFLERNVFTTRDRPPPAARTRLLERYRKMAANSGSR